MTIKDLMYHEDRTKKTVSFVKYFDQNLWYETEDGFEFAVPIEDIGTATFFAKDEAPLFMRWIRKHIEMKNESNRY